MGVIIVHGTEGAIRLPPADMLYAVEPEGVAMMRPSASTVIWRWRSVKMLIITIRSTNKCEAKRSEFNQKAIVSAVIVSKPDQDPTKLI